MGTSVEECCFLCLEASDWISIIGVFVNGLLALWIVHAIQNNLNNKRVLKDHFIGEIKDLRVEYRTLLNGLHANSISPKRILPWFKLMNIKVNDFMEIVNVKYSIDLNKLKPYQKELRELVTENEDFMKQFKTADKVKFSPESKNSFMKFQQANNHLFNEIIIEINDAN